MLIGYSVGTPGYLIYNKQTGRVITTKHVRFDESFRGRFSTTTNNGADEGTNMISDEEKKPIMDTPAAPDSDNDSSSEDLTWEPATEDIAPAATPDAVTTDGQQTAVSQDLPAGAQEGPPPPDVDPSSRRRLHVDLGPVRRFLDVIAEEPTDSLHQPSHANEEINSTHHEDSTQNAAGGNSTATFDNEESCTRRGQRTRKRPERLIETTLGKLHEFIIAQMGAHLAEA